MKRSSATGAMAGAGAVETAGAVRGGDRGGGGARGQGRQGLAQGEGQHAPGLRRPQCTTKACRTVMVTASATPPRSLRTVPEHYHAVPSVVLF